MISLAKDHLKIVGEERSANWTICKTTRQNLKDHYEVDGTLQPPAPGSMLPAMNTEITMHYSFDMAQQVKNVQYNLHKSLFQTGTLSK